MSNEQQGSQRPDRRDAVWGTVCRSGRPYGDVPHLSSLPIAPVKMESYTSCELDAEGRCVTCSDEALEARVLGVDAETGLALVTLKDKTEEIDITLVDSVAPGNVLLVHGGVAIAHLGEASDK